MTIAAGFLYDSGIVVCPDTLLSGGIISAHESKIDGYRFDDGVAVFAMAGHLDLAEAAIQQCEGSLCIKGASRTRSQIAGDIRRTLLAEYKTHIIDNHWERTEYDYSIIVAVYSRIDGLGLYCTALSQLKKSRRGYEIIGIAESVGVLALRRFGNLQFLRSLPASRASHIASYILSEAKRHQQSSVGGGSVIIHLEKNGQVRFGNECNSPLLEKYSKNFHNQTDMLLALFVDLDNEDYFQQTLNGYRGALAHLRQAYRTEVSANPWKPVAEAQEFIRRMNKFT